MRIPTRCFTRLIGLATVLLLMGPAIPAQAPAVDWVTFTDQTATRLVAAPKLGAADVEEKSYAWGDVDHDGDLDLVVARKEPWVTPGARRNVLFLNDSGVLTDRTEEFAVASTEPADAGFLTPTNDRDAILVDVDLDGWLDIVTATTTSSPGVPKWIAYPRVYMNLGCANGCDDGTADWLGFRHEPGRIPTMLADGGLSGTNPCFNHVDAGDVTGDGYPELWFIDYNSPSDVCEGSADFNNKLLLNSGSANPGYFVDVTEATFQNGFQASNDGASGWVRDMNGDGLPDLVKQTNSEVKIAWNADDDPFDVVSTPYPGLPGGAAYFVSPADLNHDGRLDLIVTDDGPDRYLLNQGNSPDGVANFVTFAYAFSHSGFGGAASDDGFGGNSYAADLNGDGWEDVLIADIDVDIAGCGRRMHIYRNLGGVPGSNVVLEEQTSGSNCAFSFGNPPSCVVAGIPADKLEGVHDVAVFDIDGDGRKDLVVGRCTGTQVYINQPPAAFPAGSLDADAGPGSQLQIDKNGAELNLSWGASCLPEDTDYAIYQGEIARPGQHTAATCSTGGASSYTLPQPAGDAYFLVVPHNGVFEGSYGTTSDGAERPSGSPACLPRHVAACP